MRVEVGAGAGAAGSDGLTAVSQTGRADVARPVVLNRRAAVRPTVTGVERYVDELTRRLVARDPVRYRPVSPRSRARGRALGQAWEQLVLPARARRLDARLIVSAANLAPLAWPGNVLVLHDGAGLAGGDAYSAAYRAWHATAERQAARRAWALVTVSQFSRRELARLTGRDVDAIEVIPGGVSDHFAAAPRADDEARRRGLGLDGPYVLTVATADARKNLPALAPVAAALHDRGVALAWAGDTRSHFSAGGAGAPAGVRALGYVSDDELAALYRGALAFVLTSRSEGFGLPCVEAMASGTPVVAADRAALPETCGGAALLVDPDDARGLTEAVLAAALGAEREALCAAGIRRAASLTWTATAERFDELLSRGSALRP